MPGRVLGVEASRRAVAALRRALEPAGFEVDATGPAGAAEAHDPEEHLAAIVRALAGAERTLRGADPALAVLFEDEVEALPDPRSAARR